jgi:hypothetical protein
LTTNQAPVELFFNWIRISLKRRQVPGGVLFGGRELRGIIAGARDGAKLETAVSRLPGSSLITMWSAPVL